MDFRTKVQIPKYDFSIDHNSFCLLIGSCFANNIGKKLKEYKVPGLFNPTGVVYNPFSVAKCLEYGIAGKQVNKDELFYSEGVWRHYDFHGDFAFSDLDECINRINNAIISTSLAITSAGYLFVSFGTAYYYIHKNTKSIVANCHKQTPDTFNRKLADIDEIVKKWTELITSLKTINPKLKIIFTISPIRHWKDGATNNQISKATLFLAVKSLTNNFTDPDTVFYFPAYEILNDELRDYRFYCEDMLHPSIVAINYIWEIFADSFFTEETKLLNNRIKKILNASGHRPFNTNTQEYKDFCKSFLRQIDDLQKQHPHLDFSEEKTAFIV